MCVQVNTRLNNKEIVHLYTQTSFLNALLPTRSVHQLYNLKFYFMTLCVSHVVTTSTKHITNHTPTMANVSSMGSTCSAHFAATKPSITI